MTKIFVLNNGQELTEEQLREIEEAKKSPIVFDEDCEELSPEIMMDFKKSSTKRNRKNA